MFQAALRPQALKCSVARTLQASEEARVTAAAKLFPGIKRLSERVLVHRRREDGRGPARRQQRRSQAAHDGPARGPARPDGRLELRRRVGRRSASTARRGFPH